MYFINLVRERNNILAENLVRFVPRQIHNVKSCCYCFDLRKGCKLIAFFEAICGIIQVYYSLVQLSQNRDIALKPQWGTPEHEPVIILATGIITIIAAQLLLAGVTFKRHVYLLLWMYICLVSTALFLIYSLIICIPQLLIADTLSSVLDLYFFLIVLAYYLQLRRAENTEDEFEILYTAGVV